MTKNEMEYLDSSLIGPAMLFLNQYFNFFIKEHIVLWLCLVSFLPNLSKIPFFLKKQQQDFKSLTLSLLVKAIYDWPPCKGTRSTQCFFFKKKR